MSSYTFKPNDLVRCTNNTSSESYLVLGKLYKVHKGFSLGLHLQEFPTIYLGNYHFELVNLPKLNLYL